MFQHDRHLEIGEKISCGPCVVLPPASSIKIDFTYFETSLLLVDDALDDVEGRVNEAEHNDQRQPSLQRHQKLVIGVGRVRQTTHFNFDVVGVFAGQHFGQDATNAVLQRQKALLVVTYGD